MPSRELGYVAAAFAVPALVMPIVLLVLVGGGTTPPRQSCDHPGVFGSPAVERSVPGVADLDDEQRRNAAAIVAAGDELSVPLRAKYIAVMTAIGESSLRVLDHGDVAGPDSRGLFQQRDNGAWGTYEDRMDPAMSARNFYRALLRVSGWETLPPTLAAHRTQRNQDPLHYAQFWRDAVAVVTALNGASGQTAVSGSSASGDCRASAAAAAAGFTIATLNLLGAGHTDGSGPHQKPGYPGWRTRLSGALRLLVTRGVSIAGLQEVHPPQRRALEVDYSSDWSVWPSGRQQNVVIWDPAAWTMVDHRLIRVPYFHNRPTGMPVVQLRSRSTGERVWVLSIHNPISGRGGTSEDTRQRAVDRELAAVREVARSGVPVFLLGDFNDGQDDPRAHCRLRGSMANAFGSGRAAPCGPPARDSGVDHIFGANITFAGADVDPAPRQQRLSDHPLVTATTASAPTDTVLPPVPPAFVDADARNWGEAGTHWTSWHTGTDFSVPCGTPVLASTSGTVEVDADQSWAGTWLVKVVTGPDSVATWYAHMQTLDVRAGQVVHAGQRVGTVGARGNATGCHLHFEVHLHNGSIYGPDNVDPSQWLAQNDSGANVAVVRMSS